MTRFARKSGLVEKKESNRKEEEATEWTEMFSSEKNDSNDVKEILEKNRKKHENDYNKRIEFENSNMCKMKKEKFHKTDYLSKKYSENIDKIVLNDLIDMKNKKQLTESEFLDRLMRESRSNKRRLDRQTDRDSKRCCFKCRLPGHSVNDCREIKKDIEQGTGICYKCGSTEHSVQKCKLKSEPGNFFYIFVF